MTTCTRVAIVRTTPATVYADYARLLQLVGIQHAFNSRGSTVLNIAKQRHFPFPGTNTPPWQLESVAALLQQHNHHQLFAPHHPRAQLRIFRGDDLDGYRPILNTYQITEHDGDFFNDTEWHHGLRVPTNLVQMHPLSLRPYTTRSRRSRLWMSRDNDTQLIDYMHEQRAQCTNILTVLDGTSIQATDTVEIKNILLASTDLIAPYVIAAMVWGAESPQDVPYIRMACEQGLGVGDDKHITLVGDITDKAHLKQQIGRKNNIAMQKALSLFDNYYRWTSRERRIFESWLYHTAWGQLFQEYQKRGVLYEPSTLSPDVVPT
ncbi:MAG: hypothetical protein AAGF95_03790 [Chloroflexota bacterium]